MKIINFLKKPAFVVFTIVTLILLSSNFNFSPYSWISLIVLALGDYFWINGIIDLRENFSILPKTRKLITGGIYKKIRHPIYLGQILAAFSWFILIRSLFLLIFVVGITIVLLIRSKDEEKLLIKRFGKKYIKYTKNTWF